MEQSNNNAGPVELPLISVIIANHNYGHWLPEAIASAIAQDYPNKQIVVSDDGSTDNSVEILSNLCPTIINANYREGVLGKDTKIIAIADFENRGYRAEGPSVARNKAIKFVLNETHLFAILDSDDVWAKDRLSIMMAKFLEYPELIGAIYTDNYSLNVNNNNIIREYRESFDLDRLLTHNMVHSGCLISKKALSAVGLYDEEMRVAEDYDLWIRIAEKMLILHIPQPLITIRVGEHNTGNSISNDIWQKNWTRISQKIAERRNAIRNNN